MSTFALTRTAAQVNDFINLQTSKIVYVSSELGNDSTGTKYRAQYPYATIPAAQTAAAAGDLILVYPGTYTGTVSLGKAGVHWHFMQGASYQNTAALGFAFSQPTGATSIVTGMGSFIGVGGIRSEAGASLFMEAYSSSSTTSPAVYPIGDMNIRLKYAVSSSYDIVVTAPSTTTALHYAEIDRCDAGSDVLAFEPTAVVTRRGVFKFHQVNSCGNYLVNFEGEASSKALAIFGVVNIEPSEGPVLVTGSDIYPGAVKTLINAAVSTSWSITDGVGNTSQVSLTFNTTI